MALYDKKTGVIGNSTSKIRPPTSRSGGSIEAFYLALVDKYDEILKVDNSSRVSFTVKSNLR